MADTNELQLPEVRLLGDCLLGTGASAGEREELTAEPEPGVAAKPASRTFIALFLVHYGLTVALVVLSFPAGIYTVFSGRLSQNVTYNSGVTPFLWIGPAAEYLPFQVNAGVLFGVLTAVYLGFLIYSVWQKERIGAAVSASLKQGFGALLSSPFVVVIVSIGFLTFTASMIDLLVSSTGAPIGGPTGDPLALFLSFAYSPLVEEFGFRVVLIGTVALILSMNRPWKTALGALWRPSRAIEGFALGSGASIIIWAATSFSAVTFGACHVVCGNTWDIGKLPEAVYGGFVLGYLYVRYGFHVAVLAHWGVDFLGSVYAFFGQAAYGIPWNSATQEYAGQYAFDLDMLFLFGLASFLLVVYLGVRKLVRWRSGELSGEYDKSLLGGG